ncbi:hypothetical protein HH310_07235 [Actinoplanes sp. TBRC 11911]|uniref:hypothetical protein n=1 Tax=Actinoplanes sp. TBRC 11911 TaxID=2729386 RepID=UPI00145CAED8|nr:hypothetical protein [Actinoplanes sp. TBRC 11911]NMO50983.1 hypothetical protein [Actinoplanes sp. TBRC 11911]
MRHFRSILYALVLAPAVWVLAGVGLTRDLSTRGRDEFAVESITGLALLVLAGAAYAILVFAPISPAGPTLAGLAYLGVAIWTLQAPTAYADVWPAGVAKEGFDLSRPGYGLAALLAVPLIATTLSARRWKRYEPPVLPLVGQIGRARVAAAPVAVPIEAARTTLLPGRRTDPDPTTVLRLPPPDDTPTVVTSSADDTTVFRTTDDTVAFTNDDTIAVDSNETAEVTTTAPPPPNDDPTLASAPEADDPTVPTLPSASTPPSDDPTVSTTSHALPPAASTPASDPTASAGSDALPSTASTAASDAPTATSASSAVPAAASSPSSTPSPDSPTAPPDASGEEPTVVVADSAETAVIGDLGVGSAAEDADLSDAAASPADGSSKDGATRSDDEPTEPVVASQTALVDDDTTGGLDGPGPSTVRAVPLPRAVPALERLDDHEEPTQTGDDEEPTRTLSVVRQANDEEATRTLDVAQQANGEEPVRTLQVAQQPDDAEATRTLRAAQQPDSDDEPTRTLRAAQQPDSDDEPTRTLRAAHQPDSDDEPTRTLWAVDTDPTSDLGGDPDDGERTRVIRLPVGDQAEGTQVVRTPRATGPAVYRTGEQTRVIPFPGTGDVGGDETQVIRLPVRSDDGESTQVIRTDLVEPPPERTEVIRLPVRTAENPRGRGNGEVGAESGRTGKDAGGAPQAGAEPDAATRQPSIVEAEAPDIADDPTSRLEPSPPRTDDDATRPMTVMKMERPPED